MAWIDDGFSTTMSFDNTPSGETLKFQEVSLSPPGLDAGGANDTTTMQNTAWRTMAPKQLLTMTEFSATCKYDPEVYDQIVDMMATITEIVITFPDSSTLTFYGFIDKFVPGEVVEGAMATATLTVVPSNATAAGVETAPAYSA